MNTGKETRLKCRACLTEATNMKDMFHHDLYEDYQKITNVQLNRNDETTVALCAKCEGRLLQCRKFRFQCQKSDILLQNSKRKKQETKLPDITRCHFKNNKLCYEIIPEDLTKPENYECPEKNCPKKFDKKNLIINHLSDHGYKEVTFEVKFYCPYAGCIHSIVPAKNKFFPTRKSLKQHIKKVHMEKIFSCTKCDKRFSSDAEIKRHNCSLTFNCELCSIEYKTKESYLVHLLRKHPALHQDYKEAKKRNIDDRKRKLDENFEMEHCSSSKKTLHTQTAADFSMFGLDSPKRSLATQTFDELSFKCLKNDVSLAVTYSNSPTQTNFSPDNSKFEYLDFNSIETQTGLNHSYEGNDFFDEPLTDMHESKRNVETAETQTNFFGIKETQTCPCLVESDEKSYRKSDVLLSFNSIETQTSEIF